MKKYYNQNCNSRKLGKRKSTTFISVTKAELRKWFKLAILMGNVKTKQGWTITGQ